MGGKGDAPPPPDYVGAAQLQGELSQEALNMQNYANRPVQNTPWSTTSWQTAPIIDPATGQVVTQWTQNTSLAPGLQSALDTQIGLQSARSDLAGNFMGRVADEYGRPFEYANLPQLAQANQVGSLQTGTTDYTPGLRTEFNFGAPIPQIDSSFRDTVANQLMTRMQPAHERQQNQLETQLANQGFTIGSEGYKRAMDELQQRQANERFQALDQSGNEAQRLFGMQMQTAQTGYNQNLGGAQFQNQALGQAQALDLARMQAANQAMGQQYGLNQQYADAQNRLRQQAIAEQMQRRGMSLNEMNALLTGQQVAMPQAPSFQASGRAETPNILGAVGQQYDAQLQAYNAQQAAGGNMLGGLFQLGAQALPLFSDKRLKRNLKRIGTHPIGVGIYEYTMIGYPQVGVLAQEVQAVRPDLVKRHQNGYLMVNYGGL